MFKFAKSMKDIKYFINIETEFCNTPEPKMYYNQELGEFTIPNEPLGFLRKQSFTLCAKPGFDDSHRYNTHFKQYGLTDVEILILRCFYGNISGAFRDDYYNGKIPAIAQEMQHVLDSLILKAPIYQGRILYRNLTSHDPVDFQPGDIYMPSHSLTTSIEDFKRNRDSYVITTLGAEKTHAHCLYHIYNKNNELQVNFVKGTQFQIIKTGEKENGNKVIYMKELECIFKECKIN